MKLAFKIVSAGVGLGAIGGTSYALNNFLTDNSISKSLKDKGHVLLSFDITKENDKSTWDPIVKAYSSSQKKINGLTIATIGSGATPTKENVNALKKECEKIIKLNKQDETNLKLAEQFCVTPIKIKDLLAKNKTVLDSNVSTDTTPELWDDKVTKYFATGAKNKITSTTLTQLDSSNKKNNRDKLKADCKKIEEKNTYDPTFHESYLQFEEWCTIPK